ncbi:MAG: hypothetical protein ABTD50_23435 [Polyangiaceae bacterium]
MRITIGPKEWTWGSQRGIRLFADPIRQLAQVLTVPDRRGLYPSLGGFLQALSRSQGSPLRPAAYSRRIQIVRRGQVTIECVATLSDNTDRRPAALARGYAPSVQGYITAPQSTWLYQLLFAKLGRRIVVDYAAGPTVDVVRIR